MRMLKYWGGIQVDYKCLFEFRNKTAVNIFNNISLYARGQTVDQICDFNYLCGERYLGEPVCIAKKLTSFLW